MTSAEDLSDSTAQRVAVLSDIHGNLPALEAVIADIALQRVDQVVVGGDLVGRGPQGSLVVERIQDLGWPAIRGNHEDYLLGFRRRQVPDHWMTARSWSAARWMADELTDEAERFIADLPLSLDLPTEPTMTIVHGTPTSNTRGLGTWNSETEIVESLEQIPGRTLICAHTHKSMIRSVPQGEVINVGAVGLPFNGDCRAQYAVLERFESGWKPDFRRVEYDLDRIFEVYESSGFLAAGGVTSHLLRIELRQARPYLVPFLSWARAHEVESDMSSVSGFLDEYNEATSLRDFYRALPRSVEPPTVGAPERVQSTGRNRRRST